MGNSQKKLNVTHLKNEVKAKNPTIAKIIPDDEIADEIYIQCSIDKDLDLTLK